MRLLALLAAVAVLAVTPSALGVTHVVGGAAVDVRSAPWSALVLRRIGSTGALCSGSIIDSLHVLTAAHCVTDGGAAVAASTLTIRAGVTNAAAPSATDLQQDRTVQSLRVHRGYVSGDRSGGDDVAVLTLTTALDLNGVTAKAIALPSPGMRLKLGDAVSLAGFGLKVAGGTIDGTLNGMNGTIVDQTDCLSPPYDTANAVLLCVFSGSSSPCGGDSGSGLVQTAPTPVLVGVTRAASCTGNSTASFADLTAPEILQFVEGSDDPPAAPRPTSPPVIERPTPVLQVGQTIRCSDGAWSGSPSFSYAWYEGITKQVLHEGSSPEYVLRDGDAGRTLFCRVTATNVGGTGFDESARTPALIRNAPDVAVPETSARRGARAVVRVQLLDWVRPLGRVKICAKLASKIGGKACRTATPAGATPAPVSLSVPVKRSSPLVRARLLVTARAADGRAVRQVEYLTVVG